MHLHPPFSSELAAGLVVADAVPWRWLFDKVLLDGRGVPDAGDGGEISELPENLRIPFLTFSFCFSSGIAWDSLNDCRFGLQC